VVAVALINDSLLLRTGVNSINLQDIRGNYDKDYDVGVVDIVNFW
jgi:hypothetical protein